MSFSKRVVLVIMDTWFEGSWVWFLFVVLGFHFVFCCVVVVAIDLKVDIYPVDLMPVWFLLGVW